MLREPILRRRQLVEQRTAEKHQPQTVFSEAARDSLQRSVRTLGLENKRVEKALLKLVANDEDLRDNFERIKAVPGVGQQAAAIVCVAHPPRRRCPSKRLTGLTGNPGSHRASRPLAVDSGSCRADDHGPPLIRLPGASPC